MLKPNRVTGWQLGPQGPNSPYGEGFLPLEHSLTRPFHLVGLSKGSSPAGEWLLEADRTLFPQHPINTDFPEQPVDPAFPYNRGQEAVYNAHRMYNLEGVGWLGRKLVRSRLRKVERIQDRLQEHARDERVLRHIGETLLTGRGDPLGDESDPDRATTKRQLRWVKRVEKATRKRANKIGHAYTLQKPTDPSNRRSPALIDMPVSPSKGDLKSVRRARHHYDGYVGEHHGHEVRKPWHITLASKNTVELDDYIRKMMHIPNREAALLTRERDAVFRRIHNTRTRAEDRAWSIRNREGDPYYSASRRAASRGRPVAPPERPVLPPEDTSLDELFTDPHDPTAL